MVYRHSQDGDDLDRIGIQYFFHNIPTVSGAAIQPRF
jgi:hypothetical protein